MRRITYHWTRPIAKYFPNAKTNEVKQMRAFFALVFLLLTNIFFDSFDDNGQCALTRFHALSNVHAMLEIQRFYQSIIRSGRVIWIIKYQCNR